MSVRHRMAAARDLLARYATVFGHFWKHRHALRTGFFNRQEAEFLPAALSLQETPDSATLRWTGRLLMGIVVFTVLWSVIGKTDIIVNATGKVIPSARNKVIASVDVASVKALYVSEGQQVRAGDLLVELDASSSEAEHDKAADAVAQARLQIARSRAMVEAADNLKRPRLQTLDEVTPVQWEAAKLHLDGQYREFRARLTRLDGEIERYAEALPLASARAEDFKSLMTDNTVSRHAWLEKEQVRVDIEGQLRDARHQRTALIAQTRKDALDVLTEASKIVEAAQQDRRRAKAYSRLLKLTAPVDGTVQQLSVHTIGGVVPAAQPLMQIVPMEDVVEVEAFLENKDVGFVRVGHEAKVKIDAFDYTKYGTIGARVQHVSQDAIEDEKRGLIYSTKVVLDKRSIVVGGNSRALSPGMSVNVEIKTGTRRVIEYVLSPLMRHQREALHER